MLISLLTFILIFSPNICGKGVHHFFMDWNPDRNQVILHDDTCSRTGSDVCSCPLPLRPQIKDQAFVNSCKNFSNSMEFRRFETGYFRNQNKPLRSCRRSCGVNCFCNRCWYLNMCCWAYAVNPTRYTYDMMYDCLFGRNILAIRNETSEKKRRKRRSPTCTAPTLQPAACTGKCGTNDDPPLGQEEAMSRDCRRCMDSCCQKKAGFSSLKDFTCCFLC